MTIDTKNLEALANRVKTDRRFCANEHHHALADGVQALLAEIEQWREAHAQVCLNYNRVSFVAEERGEQRDQLKAEMEGLRKDAERYQWLMSNTTVMFRKTPSYVNKHGVLMHTCYPPEQELDAAIDWSIAKGMSRG